MAARDDRSAFRVEHDEAVPEFVEARHRGPADLVRDAMARLFVEVEPHGAVMIEGSPPKTLEQVHDERREAALLATNPGMSRHVSHIPLLAVIAP